MYDMNRCPQTEQEFTEYFYQLIGRSLDAPANDWYDVMLKRYDWKGQLMTIPRGVGPGIKQAPDAPFFGLTQQMGTPGNPQARVFLPSNTPDPLGYYTRCMQYIKDKPGGVHGTDFLWAWFLVGPDNPYSPVTGAQPEPDPPSEDLTTRVEKLEQQVDRLIVVNTQLAESMHSLQARVVALEQNPGGMTKEQVRAAMRGEPVYVSGRTGWAPANYVWVGKVGNPPEQK